MKRRKVITCDICGKDITYDHHYKFKNIQMEYPYDYTQRANAQRIKVSHRMDMCIECYGEFENYIRDKKKGNKNEA